jgi:gluconolactonase
MAFRFLGLFLVVEACFLQVEPYRVAAQDQPAVTLVQGGFQFVEGPTMAADGAVYFTDIPANQILVWREGKKVEPWIEPSMHANGLMIEEGGRLVACQMDGSVVAYNLTTKESEVLADKFEGKRFNAPNDLVIDSVGGVYFTDPLYRAPTPLPQGAQAFYYIAVDRTVTRLSGDLPAPNGIGLSPDGKSLYVIPSMSSEMLVFDVLAPGKVSEPRVFCELNQKSDGDRSGGDGMTVDTDGNVYITTNLGVQVFSAAGKWLQTIEIPEQPANVTFAGPDRSVLVVTARNGLYTVPVSAKGVKPNRLRIGE